MNQTIDNELWHGMWRSFWPVAEWPADRSRLQREMRAETLAAEGLGAELTEWLAELCSRYGVDLDTALTAAFLVFAYRYTGQSELIAGRGTLTPESSFAQLLADIRDGQAERTAEAGEPETAMTLEFGRAHGGAAGLKARLTERTQVELAAAYAVVDGQVEMLFGYDASLFDRATVERMRDNFARLLDAAVREPETEMRSLPLVSEKELDLLMTFHGEALPYPEDKAMHQLFEAQVDLDPSRIAVRYKSIELTYGELEARSNRVANALRARGYGRGMRIALLLEHSEEKVVTILGVLKAGCAYVPLDPDLPQARLDYLVLDSAPDGVITQGNLRGRLTDCAGDVMLQEAGIGDGFSDERPAAVNEPTDLAYVIYTSGSTGKPKGTLLGHRGVCNLVRAQVKTFGIHADSRILQFANFSFDVSVMETFFALANGACVVLAPAEVLGDPASLMELLRREAITYILLSPSMLSQLSPDCAPSLEVVCSGGEVCPAGLAELWRDHVRFINAYGPTEVTVASTAWTAETDGPVPGTLPIGKGLANADLFVLDGLMNPVPVGVFGELFIGGPGVALGYLNRPELTAEKFIPHPVRPGERIYKTGDVARFLPSGDVEFLGRADDQVKIRGYRIELQEIEAVLLAHEAIREAVVLALTDSSGEKYLLGCAVPHENIASQEVWAYLRGALPNYMLPSRLLLLPQFPKAPTGKVDRKALAALQDQAERSTEYVAPRNELEAGVLAIWQDVLRVKDLGVEDHFFENGGHSLKAAQVIARIRERYSVKLPQKAVFHNPTVAELTRLLQASQQEEADAAIPVLAERALYELSRAQKRLWHFAQLEPESPLYNVPMTLGLAGELDPDRFSQAFAEVVARHDALHSRLGWQDGEPVLIVEKAMSAQVAYEDWTGYDAAEQASWLRERQTAEMQRLFDLETAPLWTATLIRCGEEDYRFLFNVHHILFDGWSTHVFLRELDACYRGQAGQEGALRYVDYAAWHNRQLADGHFAAQGAFWNEQLGGELPLLELPTDFARPPVQSYRGSSLTAALSPETTAAMQQYGRRHGVTLYMMILAAFQVLLHRYSGQEDILVGTPVAGRPQRELEDVIGMFVNTVTLRSQVNGDVTAADFIAQVKETVLSAFEHSDYPFDKLVEELAPARDLSRHPIFSVMIAQEHALTADASIGPARVQAMEEALHTAKFDLVLHLVEQEERVELQLEYATDLFAEATMQRLLGHLEQLLTSMLAAPQTQIGHLPMVTEAERRHLLKGQAADTAVQDTVQERFEAQAASTPDAVAVSFGEQRATYRELNEMANRTAHALLEQGAAKGGPVLVLLDRSVEMIAALLGIVKAGGVYVPADPEYPLDRVAYMVEDCGAQAVLTQAEYEERFATFAGAVVTVDEMMTGAPEAALENPAVRVAADDPIYIIYTSGSTGRPKGVHLTHANVLRLFDTTQSQYQFHAQDVWTMFHSYCFDFSVWEMYGALLHGGRIALVPKQTARSAEAFRQLLIEEGVTVLNQTPSAFYRLIEADETSADGARLDSLRCVIFGGEALNVQRLRSWYERYPQQPRLVNMYGITETTVHTTFRALSAHDAEIVWKGSPIGQPLGDLHIYLLDAYGQPVPDGVPGEIHVAGAGLAIGYVNAPDKTSAAFITPDLPELQGVRLYRSGDLGRRHRGELEHLGRIDHQVKVRGYRIEPGEIEAALVQLEDVRHAVVLIKADRSGENQLVAYVETGRARTVSEWRNELRDRLPEYMVPANFVALAQMPLTSNGKVDRAALPDPEQAAAVDGYIAPSSEIESELAAIWQELLGVERVGAADNFFAIGGHSLNATQLLARIEQRYGVRLSYRDIFTYATVAELAALLPQETAVLEYAYEFDMMIGEELATFSLSREEYEEQGLPEGALNVRICIPEEEDRN